MTDAFSVWEEPRRQGKTYVGEQRQTEGKLTVRCKCYDSTCATALHELWAGKRLREESGQRRCLPPPPPPWQQAGSRYLCGMCRLFNRSDLADVASFDTLADL